MKILEERWLEYMTVVLPTSVDDATRQYCEQSYYAGVAVALEAYGKVVGPHNPVPPALARVVTRMCEEVVAFAEQNKAAQERYLAARAGQSTDN